MTYYGAKQLADSFRTVRKNTVALAEEIPEDKYGFKATPEVMSVGEMLAHLVATPSWQMEMHAKRIDRMEFAMFGAYTQQAKETADRLRSKADIVKALKDEGERFAAFLAGLDDTTLASTVSFPAPLDPPTKTRFEMLLGVKEHEMHHRAQLMLVQRLIGQVPALTRQRQERQAAMAAR